MCKFKLLLGLSAALPLTFVLNGCASKEATIGAFPPADVSTVAVAQEDVPLYGEWVGTTDGFVNANIQPQVTGYLIKQNYKEGSYVHKGEVLFEIDPRPFDAALAQAQAQVAQAQGQLAQAQAQLTLSDINVKRDTPLAQARAIPQSQLDTDVQTHAQNQATIETAKAAIQAGEAAVQTAQLNVGFTKVRSLVDGVAGIATTQVGSLVAQTTILTAVSQVDPIKVYFPMSEQEYLLIADKIQAGTRGTLLNDRGTPILELTLANGQVYPHKGRIVFADRDVNSQTGTIRIVATFPNPGNVLRPGQFGRVRAETAVKKDALVIPQRAVTELQGRYQVATVGADNKVKIHTVKVGPQVGQSWVIEDGLAPGDKVISEGVSKVVDGAVVNPKPEAPPSHAASN